MENLCVSVVVPVYNQEKYLDRSVPALLNQSYKNLDIVLVNDGSADRSTVMLREYSQVDTRIRVIEKSNGGLVDATIAGIKASKGDYIAFLDPDDYVGTDYIKNFIEAMDRKYDFIAAGFYNDWHGTLKPYLLKQDKVFSHDDILKLRRNFLLSTESPNIPNDIFVSRWNKIYSRRCVLKVTETFEQCREISLGEDSIFTYLMLLNSTSGKAIRASNSYFYNIGNQNSMMKNDAIEKHLLKAQNAFEVFSSLLQSNGDEIDQAYALYSHLIDALLARIKNINYSEYRALFSLLKKNKLYIKAVDCLLKHSYSGKDKLKYILWKSSVSPDLYLLLTDKIRDRLKKVKNFIMDMIFFLKNIPKFGFKRTTRLLRFRADRRNAFGDLKRELPELEKRINPFLQKYLEKKTDLHTSTVEKNIFIFWWDGFEKAPEIVKKCLFSVKKHYSDYNIIEITKDTYQGYTDINPEIIEGFHTGNISVQTFSDILRFNLLKKNGGMWIDATIFFTSRFELVENLNDKSFESVQFASSGSFLEYKGEKCSWSGYFIASRKEGILVSAADYVFEQYYLKYKTYSIYFFIDALMMLLKLNNIDDGVLDKVQRNQGDMFILGKLIAEDYSNWYYPVISMIPQKLQWGFKISADTNNMLRYLMKLGEFYGDY